MAAKVSWDTEERHELGAREGHIRDHSLFVTVALAQAMEEAFGGVLSYVKTATDVLTGEVIVARALEGEKGAVPVRRIGTQNSFMFNFWRPLRKLALRVPPGRQFNVAPLTRTLAGSGTVFVFPLHERLSLPRSTRGEGEAEAEAAAAQQPDSSGPQS